MNELLRSALPYTMVFIMVGIVVTHTRLFPVITQSGRLRAWQALAVKTGLTYSPGSFFSMLEEKSPRILGCYRSREVLISAQTCGRLSYSDSTTAVVLTLVNRPTRRFPKGSMFYLKRSDSPIPWMKPKYTMVSHPESLGNNLNRTPVLQKLMSDSNLVDLLIQGQHLYFRRKNIEKDSDELHTRLDYLCEVAEAFERHGVWLQ